jgi:hypothetical protein
VKNYFRTEVVLEEFLHIDTFEHLSIRVRVCKRNLVIGVIYRPPSSNVNSSLNHFEDILSFVTPQSDDIFILGDFKIDDSLGNKIEESFSAYDFKQMISEPTRVTLTSQKIIDVIYTNKITMMRCLHPE